MGNYLNPDNSKFQRAVNSDIYVDKTGLIKYTNRVMNTMQAYVCVSRPRRFGKSMAADMLTAYYSKGCDSREVFSGLEITEDETFDRYLNKYDTVFLNVQEFLSRSSDVKELIARIKQRVIRELTRQYPDVELFDSTDLAETMQDIYAESKCPFVLIIDEWDCIFREFKNDKEAQEKYLDFLRDLIKDKSYIHLAYMTGILPIKKYGTHSALNMFDEFSMANPGVLAQYVGFTENEVRCLCSDYQMDLAEIKEWYDGYNFGEFEVYCPWDVMNYLRDLQMNPLAKPESYWKNTSDNGIIRSFIDYAGQNITKKLETLLAGGFIFERIDENLTYDYLHSSEENLWSVLYLTGYLTRVRERELPEPLSDGMFALTIPNAEIKEIFETTVVKWFQDSAKIWNRKALFDAVWSGNSSEVTKEMSRLLRKTISYHDYREDFYHAFLAGIFTGAGYTVESNKEHGEGRSDIVVYDLAEGRVAIFEAKYAKSVSEMEKDCDRALNQIEQQMYAKDYEEEYDEILCYGISFFKKRCLVKK